MTRTPGSTTKRKPLVCMVADCAKPHFGHRYCQAHYTRWRKYGDPTAGSTSKGALRAELERAVSFTEDHCFFWKYTKNTAGYAQIRIDGKGHLVRRLVCERIHGQAPIDKPLALHSCAKGHLGCVSPRHLRWGDDLDNADDSRKDGTAASGERHGRARLTADIVRSIRALKGTAPQPAIASMFGISRSHAGAILRGEFWAGLEP